MKKVKELIVVEGKHDYQRLVKLYDAEIICTHGLAMDEEVMKTIQQADKTNGVIVITDPDNPGRIIRDKVSEIAPKAKHVFVNKKDAIGKRNVGIEYVSDEILLKCLDDAVTFTNGNESISHTEFLGLQLYNNKDRRDYLCDKLKIGKCNNKRLFKYLNMMNVSLKEIEDILKDYEH